MAITIIEKNTKMFNEVFANARTAYQYNPVSTGEPLDIEWVRSELREKALRDPKARLEDSGEGRFTLVFDRDSWICLYSHVTRKKIVTPQVPQTPRENS